MSDFMSRMIKKLPFLLKENRLTNLKLREMKARV